MSTNEFSLIDLVREYLRAIERGDTGSALAHFFTEDVIQEELPNRLNPNGGRSDLATILERSEQGKRILISQQYIIRSAIAQGDTVAVEADWTGTLAIPLGTIPAGGQMHAHFAMFFEFADGKIRRQRNYDCFEPW